MSLALPTRLGAYEVVALIGAGSMGEVYRARDSRLGREVAVKILKASFAADADRLRRFEQEVRAAAALNHPNIVVIHSVEQNGDLRLLAMELVEGETLATVIRKGRLPLDRILKLGIQIADGVSAAHQLEMVHRDLKPANVMVTSEGRAKILDFGLAKLIEDQPASGATTTVPTESPTAHGVIVGTVAYMSPEQAEGKALDCRSDLFSLGIILYEMSTGERPFKGQTNLSTIASILRDTPRRRNRTECESASRAGACRSARARQRSRAALPDREGPAERPRRAEDVARFGQAAAATRRGRMRYRAGRARGCGRRRSPRSSWPSLWPAASTR